MQPPLATTSLLLRHFTTDDATRVLALSREPGARMWLPSQVYRDLAHAESVIADLVAAYEDPGTPRGGPYALAIEHRADGVLVGHVGFSPFENEVEIGFGIAEAYQRRGYATEATAAAVKWTLARFGLARIIGVTAADNVASQRTLLRAGFAHSRSGTMMFQGVHRTVSTYIIANPGG